MNNTYYVTWDEYKNRMSYARIMCVLGSSVKQVRENIVNPEQDERRRQGDGKGDFAEIGLNFLSHSVLQSYLRSRSYALSVLYVGLRR